MLIINLIGFILFLKNYRNHNIICFEFFFSLVYLIVSYSFFFISTENIAGLGSILVVDYLSYSGDIFYKKAILISGLGYLFFILGCIFSYNSNLKEITNTYQYNKWIEKVFLYISLFTFVLFLMFDYKQFMTLYSDTPDNYTISYVLWFNMAYLNYLIVVFMNAKAQGITNLNNLIKEYPLAIISFCFLMFIYLISGHRTNVIGLILPFFFLYSFCIHQLSVKFIILSCIIGFTFMIFIGSVRSGQDFNFQNKTSSELLIDFTGASVATPFFIQYVTENGITYGSNYLIKTLSAIPFLAGFYKSMNTNISPDSFVTYTKFFMDTGSGIGMGTSLVGDMYYSFALPGVIILMFILGYIVSILYRKAYERENISIYVIICIVVLLSQSYFMPRNDLVSFIRPVTFQCISYFFINYMYKKLHPLEDME